MTSPTNESTGLAVVHLMKTGGTSLGYAIRASFPPAQCYPQPIDGVPKNGPKVEPSVLLGLPAEQRAALRFVSVHMPAWVVEAAVGHLPSATILREPVERTVSHLRQLSRSTYRGMSLGDIWNHPPVHRRLSNYQTRVFAEDPPMSDPRAIAGANRDEFAAALRAALASGADMSPEQHADLRDEMRATASTSVSTPTPMNPDSLATAIVRLRSIDLVGTTDSLTHFARRVQAHTNIDLASIGHENAALGAAEVSDALRERINEDCALDARLYATARELAAVD